MHEKLVAWQYDYNHCRPHGSLGHLTPSEFATIRGQSNQKKRPTSSSKLSGFRGGVNPLDCQALNRPLKRGNSKEIRRFDQYAVL
jgi:hypothetical protein